MFKEMQNSDDLIIASDDVKNIKKKFLFRNVQKSL